MSLLDLLAARNPWWADPDARVDVPERRRSAFGPLGEALQDPSNQRGQLLLGPRQVGKTVLLRQLAHSFLDEGWPPGNVLYFDFKDERYDHDQGLAQVLDAKPTSFRSDHPRLVLLDEITQSKRWELALKRIVDDSRLAPHGRSIRLLATDSAAALMQSGARESLQGRIDITRIGGLTFSEALRIQSTPGESERDTFLRIPGATERYLARGGLPEHLTANSPERAWERIRRDVADSAIARDLTREHSIDVERVTALFRHLVQESGSLFEATHRADDLRLGGERGPDARTVRRWTTLLEQAFLIESLTPWHPGLRHGRNRPSRALRARRKLYAQDHGYIPAFSPYAAPVTHQSVRSRVFETVVFTHLRTLCSEDTGIKVYYFREKDTTEVDFVLAFEDLVIGIEVTAGRNPDKKIPALERGAKRASLDGGIVVHGGPLPKQVRRACTLCPIDAFLLSPRSVIDECAACIRASH